MASKIIPSIVFCHADLKPGSEEWESTKAKVFKALEEYGCFEAIYDKVSNEIREDMFATLKEIFQLESKVKEYINIPYQRHEDQFSHAQFNEFRCIIDLMLPECVEIFANTFWPHHGNPHFCNVVKSYSNSLKELDEMVKRMIFESLGLKHYIDEFMDENIFMMRFMNYKKENVSELRLQTHTDPGLLTIMKQDLSGLQVLMKNGDWIQPNVSPNSFIILADDSLKAWTNGRIPSAMHRVIIPEEVDSDRFSVMLFSVPKSGYIVEAPKELMDKEHPMLYKPYNITEYYKYVSTRADYRDGDVLKAYSGV